ncbi:MAG: hypothetical protein ABII22_04605 [Candidatus Micrarchaeota archaeon]
MGDDKKATPKKEFFKNPNWWLTFLAINIIILMLKYRFLSASSFAMVFDIFIVFAMLLMLIELVHDRTLGDRLIDTFILVIIFWLVLRVFTEVPTEYNFLFP